MQLPPNGRRHLYDELLLKEIDHDPDEIPKTDEGPTWVFPALYVVVALLWIGFLAYHSPDWYSVMIGIVTGFAYTSWMGDKPFFLSAKKGAAGRRRDL